MFQLTLIDDFFVQTIDEILNTRKGAIGLALCHQRFHGCAADVFDGSKRIAQRLTAIGQHLDPKGRTASVHIRWQNLDLQSIQVLLKDGQFVGVVNVQCHGPGQEFDREVRLKIGCLVSNKRIGSRV